MKTQFLFLVITFSGFYIGCTKIVGSDNVCGSVNCNGVDSRFSATVLPIFQRSCATDQDCHGKGSTSGPGELSNYAKISSAASAIDTAVVTGSMPKGSSLTAAERNVILCWIRSGTPNN